MALSDSAALPKTAHVYMYLGLLTTTFRGYSHDATTLISLNELLHHIWGRTTAYWVARSASWKERLNPTTHARLERHSSIVPKDERAARNDRTALLEFTTFCKRYLLDHPALQ